MAQDQSVQAIKVKLELQNLREVQEQLTGLANSIQADNQRQDLTDRGQLNSFFKIYNDMQYKLRGQYTGDDPNMKAAVGMVGDASKSTDKIADGIMKIMKTGLGIIEDIHARIKKASPLLQSVESLFNLAVQLFFMPLGNKLATVMIPAIMQLVDDVMEMWDKIEGMDLGQMLTEMIDTGAKIFGQYFQNLGEELAGQTGIIGTLGEIMIAVGDFIEDHLADLLKTGLDVLKWILDNLGTLVDAFIEFKILSISLQMAQVGAAIGGAFGPIGAAIGAGIGLGAGEIGGHVLKSESGVQDMVNAMPRSWTGSYVGATEGGRGVVVGDGGEGEFILPEGRLKSMMDDVSDRMVDVAQAKPTQTQQQEQQSQTITNNFYINGYTDRELVDKIRSTVNEQVSQSRLRSGF